MIAAATPTRRELVILGLLLVSLLYYTSHDHSRPVVSGEDDLLYAAELAKQQQRLSAKPGQLITTLQGRRTTVSWDGGAHPIPETEMVAHVPGWTIFDNLFLYEGTLFIVTDNATKIPDTKYMISLGLPIENGAEAEAARLPSEKEMRVVSTREAQRILGKDAQIIDGVTWFVNDPPQFIQHYYHWSAELFFGFWRTYSSLDPHIRANGSTTLPPPRRMMFKHTNAAHWRDYAHMNELVLRSNFPALASEFEDDWEERATSGRAYVFDRVMLADRSSAMLGFNYHRSQRTASEPFVLPGSAHWWATIRDNVIRFIDGQVEVDPSKLVITYISRQEWGRRMLIPADHDRLVEELHKLRDTYGYEVNIVSMDKMSRIEQLELSARTTIMMGVHGNGLTSLLWMKPTPRSTVMEFFFPGGFAHDYEYTTRALGMVHYGFWGDQAFTSPQTPDVLYPEGFQGNSIPIDGAVVARLCHQRLSLAEEADD